MKYECNVARDLMPLCIDGVASEESKRYVEEHIAECTECAMTYGEMRVELPRISAEKEKAEMEQAAQQMRRKRRNSKCLLIALTALLTALVVWAGVWGYDYANHHGNVPIPLNDYEAYLCRTRENGQIMLNIDMKDKTLVFNVTGCGSTSASGGEIWTVSLNTTYIPNQTKSQVPGQWTSVYEQLHWVNGMIYAGDPAKGVPLEKFVMVSGEDTHVIYRRGDEIPFCSEEMEAYYKAMDEMLVFTSSPANRSSFDYPERETELLTRLEQIRKTVPEWN
ncbi:MAG: zf-HC2 domain-containing protein [Aristaeellaceae bacterium]